MNNNLGLGVMLHALGGNERTVTTLRECIGRKISHAEVLKGDDPNRLRLDLEDWKSIYIFDDGQSCCEYRYMTTDDDVKSLEGAVLTGVSLRDAPEVEDEFGDVHEVQFLLVETSLGAITLETHNEHNGYYGGFTVVVRYVDYYRKWGH